MSRPTVEDLLAAAVGAVPGGAARPGQQAMATAVTEAVSNGEHLLVQAGTGTGKSLAYLVPALLVDGPVVVSTATLALQSQLVDHDLPRLADAVEPLLRRRPTFAVLKGRHHYACLARLDNFNEDEPADALFEPEDGGSKWLGEAGRLGKQVERLRDWALESETGDRDELDPGVDDSAWRLASMPARECVGAARCPYGSECFAEASRARAREADIVVTNHSLLAVDMLAGRHIVPPHKLLVIDEAHELADRVSSAAQAELSPEAIERAARRVRTLVDPDDYDRLTESGDALADGLTGAEPGRLTAGLPAAIQEALTLLDAACRRVLDRLGDVKADDPDPVRKQQARAVLSEMTETAQRLLASADFDVAWIERGDRRRAIVVAPLSVAGTLSNHLYEDRTVVATSATLALGGRFDTVARSLGLAETPSTEDPKVTPSWTSLDVGSPFEYPKQGILYVAAHLPRPSASGLSDAAAEELIALVQALGGRTLGLFSSRRAAERAAEVLRAKTDLHVLLQGEEALPLLVRKFREDRNSCLMGVMSLWQGVDVPGDACQLVVIDRLPFPRPDEPLAAARAAAVDAAGGSGFAAVSVPIAAVRLAQGVGRLIRSASDKGVVAVLDSRLETARGYGGYLRKTLPPFWYTTKADVVHGALRRLR
ncbi:ATP-dependent DNA helicase [Rugosimonospora acidiphila]|uniref:DNA 5'-3' helicase n=2 Tax=Rugosimonospora acidiphila TaxID=556531 RepID=A0ABP9RH60_9ACTN